MIPFYIIRTRWRKVLLDLWGNKTRTLLVILAIAVGVFAIGFIASAQAILIRELQSDYQALQAASAYIYTDPFDDKLVKSISDTPGVIAAMGGRGLNVRVDIGNGEWRTLVLTLVPDTPDFEIDRISPVAGDWPIGRADIAIERLSINFINTEIGDTITIDLGDGTIKELDVVGTTYDNSVPAGDIAGVAFGYINQSTLERLGRGSFYTELRFRVGEEDLNIESIQEITAQVQNKIERSGREIYGTQTPPPGEHWAEEIIATLIILFFAFGGIILFLAGFLVINTVTALITQQMQQIGVMKLVGARRLQIMSMYIIMVFLYGLLALLIGIPSGVAMGRMSVNLATTQLNVTVDNQSVPMTVIGFQALIGILIPVGAALWPVLSGVGTTTQKALNSGGMEAGSTGNSWIEQQFLKLQRRLNLQRPLIISLRNTLRRKGRLILTMLILIMGTALYISVLTVRTSVSETLNNFLRYHAFDVGLTFNRPIRAAQLTDTALRHPEVTYAEAWFNQGTNRIRPDGSETVFFTLTAVPPNTPLLDPKPESGRWLTEDDTNAVVVNTFFMVEEPDVQLGDEIVLDVNGRELTWQVVGVIPAAADGTTRFYVNYDHYTYITRNVGKANSVQVSIQSQSGANQTAMEVQLSQLFNANGFQVSGGSTAEGVRSEFFLRFEIVIQFLIVMAILLGALGGLGLTTTMSINILERIREIGVLRAIGASNRAVRRIVVFEGLAVGFLSWLTGMIISIPLSVLLSEQIGLALLQKPLDFSYSWGGLWSWLIIVLILAAIASLGPAQSASRLTIREVLAHE